MRPRRFVATVPAAGRSAPLWVALIVAAGSSPAEAHHSFATNFDVDKIVEVRGKITALQWQNPHVLMKLQTPDGETWAVESQAKNLLERTDIVATQFSVDSDLTLAGYPARSGRGMFALNALLGDGSELILRAGVGAHFGGRVASNPDALLAGGLTADTAAQAAGLFRVWSMQFAGEGRWRWPDKYPLTPAGAAAQARFNEASNRPQSDCIVRGMPWIMDQPFPIEFTWQGSNIVLRHEADDVTRTIHMDDAPPTDVLPTPYGYSVGRWDDGALIVQTTALSSRYLHGGGIPLTPAVTLEERFAVSPDGSRLNYQLTVTDPGTFTEPLTVERYWIWRPGITLEPYGCERESAPR